MKYAHIIFAAANELWAMEREKLSAVVAFLSFQAAGGKLDDAEIQAKITKQDERTVAKSDGSIALLPLRGVISNRAAMLDDISSGGGTSCETFGRSFMSAVTDDNVKAIVIDTDTPGGASTGVDELSKLVFDARGTKPIIAHVNANCASGGYWIASAADEMVVTPSGSVGSIGVYSIHDDLSKALEEAGINKTIVSAGKYKTELNCFGPLSDEARAYLQSRVDNCNDMFVAAVARNRGVSQAAVRNGFGQGRMIDALDAVDQGMADKVGTLDDTLQRFGASLYMPAAQSNAGRRAFAKQRELRALDLAAEF